MISKKYQLPYYFKETAFQNAINHIGASTYLWDDVESAATIGYETLLSLYCFLQWRTKARVDQQKLI
jgi:hypothetical protein